MRKIRLVLIVTLTIAYLMLAIKFFTLYNADVLFERADDLLSEGEIALSLERMNRAVEKNPNEPIYYRGRAKAYLSATVNQDMETEAVLKKLALADLEKAYSLNPKNLATLRNSVPLYYFLTVDDLSRSGNPQNVDTEFLPYTIDYYRRVESIAGNDVGIYVLLAKYRNKLGLEQDTLNALERIRELRPDLLDWHDSLRDINVGL